MRRLLIVLLVAALALPILANLAWADIPINERVSLDGVLRFRGLYDERDFDLDNTDPAFYATMRTMIGFKIQASNDVMLRAKLKDSRYIGVPNTRFANPDVHTVGRVSSSFLQLQEGYIFARDVFDSNLDFQIGRFEMAYGRGRIMGASAWGVQGPNAYDGFRLMLHQPDYQVDFFYSVIRDYSFGIDFPYYHDPSQFAPNGIYRFAPAARYNEMKRYIVGVAGSFMDGMIQPMLLVDWDSYDVGFEATEDAEFESAKEQEFFFTPAVYSQMTFEDVGAGRIELEGDLALQVGQTNDADAYPDSYSLFSYLLAMEARYHFDQDTKPYIGLGFDATGVGEGDEDPQDVYVFYQPFYTQHKFRGYMDYFANVHNGLLDAYITTSYTPMDWLKLKADIHNFNFMTNQGRVRPNGQVENMRLLGQEIDLLASIKVKESYFINAGYSIFLPTDEFAWRTNGTAFDPTQVNKDGIGNYAYLVFTAKF